MTRLLVTGATGFIGSALNRACAAGGHEVIAVSSRPADAVGDSRVQWRQLDLLHASGDELQRLIDDVAPTHCIHAAWYTNHADYLVHQINRDWLAASLRLADACHGVRLTALGTCLEYDVSLDSHCVEDETPLRPETLYAQCKRELFEALAGDSAWARVFFVYGPGDRGGRLVPYMLDRFAGGEAAGPKFGGLRRDYIHVEDLADQILQIALSDVTGAVNTGTGQAPTLSDLFAAGARALGRPELALANDETGDQPVLIAADMTRFREQVGKLRARSVADGLASLVEARA
ncbi:UDP-glucose 4-epimerase [Sphingomonas sp. F9_3S_D5_B_2]